MIFFWVIAILLIAAALMFVLPPLFKRDEEVPELDRKALNVAIYRDQLTELDSDMQNGTLSEEQYQQAREEIERGLLESSTDAETKNDDAVVHAIAAKASAWFIICALPLVALFAYSKLGGGDEAFNPEQQQAQTSELDQGHEGANVEQMIASLEARLDEDPNDSEGWVMLGRSYYFSQQYPAAARAYGKAVETSQVQNADLLADYADALALASGRNLMGKPMSAIKQALEIDPNHPKSLWLAGTAEYQGRNFVQARDYWTRLLRLLQPNSENAQMIQANLDEISKILGEAPAALTAPVASGPSVSGTVQISDALAEQASVDDVLFVFARAASGPRMPLAIVRKQVRDLPLEFTLDDSMAMNPAMKMSNFSEIVVGARVSKSGTAMPQSGDLEGYSATLSLDSNKSVNILIDRIVK